MISAEAIRVLDELPGGWMVVGPDDRIVWVSHAAQEWLESGAATLTKAPLREGTPLRGLLAPLLERVRMRHDEVILREGMLELPGRAPKPAQIELAPTKLLSGGILVHVIPREHPALGRREHHIEELNLLTQMAHVVAHEVKNPLGGIQGAAQLLGMEADGDDQKKMVTMIIEETARIRRLVDDLLNLTEPLKLKQEPVNIHEVLDRVVQTLKMDPAFGLKPEAIFDPSLPPVLGDRDRMIQLFLNLAKNGLEAMGGEGKIVLTTAAASDLKLSSPGSGPLIRVTIRDFGPGLPPELLQRVFTPFFSTKRNGMGIGLTVAQRIVLAHGGLIVAENHPHGGLAIHTYLPSCSDEQ